MFTARMKWKNKLKHKLVFQNRVEESNTGIVNSSSFGT